MRHGNTVDAAEPSRAVTLLHGKVKGMKHYILAKFSDGTNWRCLVQPVRALFEQTLAIRGVHAVSVHTSCSERSNRYHLMIEIDMEPAALPLYDASEAHRVWKEAYGPLLASKAIFDCE